MLEPLRKISAAITAAEAEGAPVDALFIPGGQEHLELVGRLLPQAQINTQQVKLIGTGGMDYPNAGREAGLVGAWYPGPDPRGWTDFSQKFAKSYGHSPPRIASLAYDAVSLAIALAGGPEGQRYTQANITRAGGFTGIDGGYRLLADGTADRSLAILEVQKFGAAIVEAAPSAPKPARRLPYRARTSRSSTSSISSSNRDFGGFEALRQPQHDLVEHHAARCRGAQAICSEPLDATATGQFIDGAVPRPQRRSGPQAGSGRCPPSAATP